MTQTVWMEIILAQSNGDQYEINNKHTLNENHDNKVTYVWQNALFITNTG